MSAANITGSNGVLPRKLVIALVAMVILIGLTFSLIGCVGEGSTPAGVAGGILIGAGLSMAYARMSRGMNGV